MGAGGVGARAPSHAAYYVALAGVLALLLLLLMYFAYFCIKRVKELVQEEYKSPRPTTASYPVQPVVRDGARAMAQLCQHLPSDNVFPAPQPHSANTTLQHSQSAHSTPQRSHSMNLTPQHQTHSVNLSTASSTDVSTLPSSSKSDPPPSYEQTQPPHYKTLVPPIIVTHDFQNTH
ncbi:hypothetical protein ACJJTC_007403 [Scirpophaga incertulas]